MALQRAFGGVRGAPAAQLAARRLVEVGDPCSRTIGDVLRLGLGVAGRVKLVDEVLAVLADARAKLRELGLQLEDRRRLGGQPVVRGLEVGWGVVVRGVDAVQGEVLVVPVTHGGLEALNRGSLVVQLGGLARRDLSSVELVLGRGVDDEQFGGFSRASARCRTSCA